ncbi:MAG: DUF3078 domain-containing protein, partial [Bacteroidales bacterium]
MNKRLNFLFIAALLLFFDAAFSQDLPVKDISTAHVRDSLLKMGYYVKFYQEPEEISFDVDGAIRYIEKKIRSNNWKNYSDPLRTALEQLVFYATTRPYDSIRIFLESYPYDSLNIPSEKFIVFDSVKVKMPVVIYNGLSQPADSLAGADSLLKLQISDSLRKDIKKIPADSAFLDRPGARVIYKDTCLLIVSDTLNEIKVFSSYYPFIHSRNPFEGDSLATAVKTLTGFLAERDSSIIIISGISETTLPVWLNSKSGDMKRYWLKNEYDDSVTVWIGAAGRDTIGIYLEEGIIFRRPMKHMDIYGAQLDIKQVDTKRLQEVSKLYVKPRYWNYRSEAAFVFNQTMLTNWVKGGENSISTAMDITGFADYNNKELKLTSNNFIRLKYGLIKSGDKPLRKNLDLLETNSKLNHKAFGKFDFSAIMLFKTQITKGYNYPNDSVPVSKFLNPAVLTLGFGLDYKPDKTTSINVAPLSYKATFVPDTATIDQTKYGVPKDRRSMHEPGASIQISNEFKPLKTVIITNRLQLFTNYIHN